jgi:hypothetical protein
VPRNDGNKFELYGLSREIGTSCEDVIYRISNMVKSRNGPITGHGRGDPSLRFGTGGDPPWVFEFRGNPAKVEARGEPPEIESRGDFPETIYARNGPFLEWLVFSSICSRNGQYGRGMPGWEKASPLSAADRRPLQRKGRKNEERSISSHSLFGVPVDKQNTGVELLNNK